MEPRQAYKEREGSRRHDFMASSPKNQKSATIERPLELESGYPVWLFENMWETNASWKNRETTKRGKERDSRSRASLKTELVHRGLFKGKQVQCKNSQLPGLAGWPIVW